MTKFFSISQKKLKLKYNRYIFKLCILPIAVAITLAIVSLTEHGKPQPISYYYAIIVILTAAVGYSFAVTLIGSLFASWKLKYHKSYTFIDIENQSLVISIFTGSSHDEFKVVPYQKLWIVDLAELQDVYVYNKKVVILAPMRCLHEPAKWLKYSRTESGIEFEHWWYNKNGGYWVNGVSIGDFFIVPERIVKTIERAAGVIQRKAESRRRFHERMITIAKEVETKNTIQKN